MRGAELRATVTPSKVIDDALGRREYWLVRALSSNVGYGHAHSPDGNYAVLVFGDCEADDELCVPDGPLGHPCALTRLWGDNNPIGVAVRPVTDEDELTPYNGFPRWQAK